MNCQSIPACLLFVAGKAAGIPQTLTNWRELSFHFAFAVGVSIFMVLLMINPQRKVPWVKLAGLFSAILLYGILHRSGTPAFADFHRHALDILPLYFFGRYLSPELIFEILLTYTRLYLWILLALLSVSILIDILESVFPPEEHWFPEGSLFQWRKKPAFSPHSLIEGNFSSCAKSAERFVEDGKRETVRKLLQANGVPVQWLDSHKDRKISLLAAQISTAAVSLLIAFALPLDEHLRLPVEGYKIPPTIVAFALILGGLLAGTLLSAGIIKPLLSHINRNKRRDLILRWIGRHDP